MTRIVWLFSLVLGFSRLIWGRFVLHQDMQTVLRCHMAAFAAIGGVPGEILYDRMKTIVIGETAGSVVYNRALIDFARHYGFGGNLYSVPDATRKRIVEVHTLADEVRILEDGILIASHPLLEGRDQRRVAPGHRKMARIARPDRDKPILILRTGDVVAARPLGFYQAVGRRLAHQGDRP